MMLYKLSQKFNLFLLAFILLYSKNRATIEKNF